MPNRQRLQRIEAKPKEVLVADSWRDIVGLSSRPDLADEIATIREHIQKGHYLPETCYRKRIGLTRDRLLIEDGIMHLHLGSKNSPELLFVVQYPSEVVFLEVADHNHFKNEPPGSVLRTLHESKLTSMMQARMIARQQRFRQLILGRKPKL